jgi:5-methylcytosine-specific restriction endonuclease McrA
LEYRHRFYRFTTDRKKRASELAKKRGFGKWMFGKKSSLRQKEAARLNFTGTNNPRWNGGVTRAESHKNWVARNRDRSNFYSKTRKARVRGAAGTHTYDQWEELKAKYKHMCLRCRRREPDIKLTQDHIVPISKGGGNDISNIQPLCLDCNMLKYTLTIDYRPQTVA